MGHAAAFPKNVQMCPMLHCRCGERQQSVNGLSTAQYPGQSVSNRWGTSPVRRIAQRAHWAY